MSAPISVVMPVYNHQNFIGEAIESILAQTFTDFEMIIVDDCSTDDSLTIAVKYQKLDPRVRICRHVQNTGIVGARNTGLKLSTGKYIAWMDSDDISMPDRLEKQFKYMEMHPQVGVSSGSVLIIDENGILKDVLHMPQTHTMIAWGFCFFDSIINPAAMTLRELIMKSGGYRDLANSKEECFPEDYDLWTRIVRQTQFYNFDEILIKLRKHDTNITKTRLQSTLDNSVRICQNYIQVLLGHNVPVGLIENLWGISTKQSLKGIPSLLSELYDHFSKSYALKLDEKKYIRKDIASRLFGIAIRHPRDPYSADAILKALSADPHLPVEMGKKVIHKLFSRKEVTG
ncbi:MAG: glycosyltransferase family 2 protein [Bacteroidota bacterium]